MQAVFAKSKAEENFDLAIFLYSWSMHATGFYDFNEEKVINKTHREHNLLISKEDALSLSLCIAGTISCHIKQQMLVGDICLTMYTIPCSLGASKLKLRMKIVS